ncbi:conserved protein of unknown function [Enterobacter cancerogenus]|nr:conserved protein of unknown function [Enterobacter cancerogenus]
MGCVAQSDLRVTITDGKGRKLLTFSMGAEERYIISTNDNSITHRKLSRDERYWSKETMMEVVREMTSQN